MLRTVMSVLFVVVVLIGVGGCAAVHENQTQNQLLKSPIDSRYVSAVETMGKRFGNRVYWVNPPKQDKQTSN